MKKTIILIICLLTMSFGKIMTANLGGKCLPSSKVDGGYTICHAINVKYNLEKGRITTDGALADSNITFMIRMWDVDSMRLDFIATDLHVNMAYAGDEYKVPIDLIKDVHYIEIKLQNDDDNYSPWSEDYECFDDNTVPWVIYNNYDDFKKQKVKCLSKDTTLTKCKVIQRGEYNNKFEIKCFEKNRIWKENNEIFTLAYDSFINFETDEPNIVWANCADGYELFEDRLACKKVNKKNKQLEKNNNDYIPDGGWYSDSNDTNCPPSWQNADGTCKQGW